ncbi:MAG: histidine-type phosphatase [Burkholderiales bacterium]|nr:MAG: histidine-type phosphatase [Burkholderiales bacterium]
MTPNHIRFAPLRYLVPALVGLVATACASSAQDAGSTAGLPGQQLKLERVVMLMRHGVRPPTKAQVVPDGMHDQPWPTWQVGFGELTQHGYDAVRLVGEWDRTRWASRGLLPAQGCPAKASIEIAASSKSRAQATARALIEGMVPGCGIEADFPASPDEDSEFHPLESGAMPIDADEALRAVAALAPPGGLPAEVAAHAKQFALLDAALGCTGARAATGCRLSDIPPALVRIDDDRPDVGAPFGIASTASQTFLLEYLEGMPMQDVAWGRLTRAQIEDVLQLHTLKFYYEGRAPYVAARAASPLAARMLTAMEHGPKLTVLVGHDTNIGDLGGLLDLHWKVPSYPRDNPPPGGALGFEVLADPSGKKFVRAFYRSQTMDQVRELQPLTASNAPAYQYLTIPGCAEPCPLMDFAKIVRSKQVEPVRRSDD